MAATKLLQRENRPDAILAFNDILLHFPSHTYSRRNYFRPYTWLLNVCESGADAIRIGRIVVVVVAVVVDIPEVRRVADIWRTQPPVVGGA